MCSQRSKTQVSNVVNVHCRHVHTYKASGIVEAICTFLIVIYIYIYIYIYMACYFSV